MDRQTLTIGGVLLAVVVVGLGIMFFLSGDSGDVVLPPSGAGSEGRSAIAEMRARSEATAPAAEQPRLIERPSSDTGGAAPAAAPTGAASAAAGAAATTAAAPAATSGDPVMEERYEQAKGFLAEGKVDDALIILRYLASRQGHGPAAFELATLYDPLKHDSSPLDKADPLQAYKNYTIAAASNIGEASSRLDALHQWAEQAAANGDAEADRLLLQWEQ
jgi:hypothetical protein